MNTVRYGIFGQSTVVIDDDGFIEIPVIVQESGCFAGAPPAELRITQIGYVGEDEFMRQYVAMLNRKTDLPFYLTTAKVKITTALVKVTDADNDAAGIPRLKD